MNADMNTHWFIWCSFACKYTPSKTTRRSPVNARLQDPIPAGNWGFNPFLVTPAIQNTSAAEARHAPFWISKISKIKEATGRCADVRRPKLQERAKEILAQGSTKAPATELTSAPKPKTTQERHAKATSGKPTCNNRLVTPRKRC